MKRSFSRYVLSAVALLAAMNFLSCGNQRKLVSITVQPGSAKFPTPTTISPIVFTALGTYKHPPDTRDITKQVVWKTDNPDLLNIGGGTVTSKGSCGIGDISANVNDGGNLIIGYATVTINDPTDPLCPGGAVTQAVVIVTPAGSGSGMVVSFPAGISCPGTICGAQFTVGSTVTLTATPDSSSTFGGWTGCTSSTNNTCLLTVPAGTANVIATFN